MRLVPGLEALLWGSAAVCFGLGFGLAPDRELPFEPGATRAAGVVRVVTWNVGGSGAHGGHPLQEQSLPHVARILSALDADLCVLQEIQSSEQLQDLLEALPAGTHASLSPGRSDSRVAILAWRGHVERLRLAGGGRGDRLAVLYRAAQRSLAVATLHADAFSARKRNALIGGTLQALRASAPGVPVLFAGDFNLDLDIDKRRDLFTDDEHLDVETYNYVATDLVDVARGGGSTAEPDRRLDYVFCDPDAFAVEGAGPWKGQRHGAMDHDPVVADLRFQDGGEEIP